MERPRLWGDIDFAREDESRVWFSASLINRSEKPQPLVLHMMGFLNFPPYGTGSDPFVRPVAADLPTGAQWVDALDYKTIVMCPSDPRNSLTNDGQRRKMS